MSITAILLIAAGVVALGDWIAVALRRTRVEHVLKPAVLAVLIAAAVTSDVDHRVQPWVIVALGLGLVGDIGLMLSRDDTPDPWFLAGLAAFMFGHAAWIVAFLRYGVQGWQALGGALVAIGVAGLALPAAVRGAVRGNGRELGLVICAYAVLLGAMAAGAAGTTQIATAIGGALFVCSDALLARERFVSRSRPGEVVVMITYHGAQALLLIGLLR